MKLFNPHNKVVAGPAPDGNKKVMVTRNGKIVLRHEEGRFMPKLSPSEKAAWETAVAESSQEDPFA